MCKANKIKKIIGLSSGISLILAIGITCIQMINMFGSISAIEPPIATLLAIFMNYFIIMDCVIISIALDVNFIKNKKLSRSGKPRLALKILSIILILIYGSIIIYGRYFYQGFYWGLIIIAFAFAIFGLWEVINRKSPKYSSNVLWGVGIFLLANMNYAFWI